MRKLTTNPDTLRKRLRRLIGEYDKTQSTTFAETVLPIFNEIGKLALIGGAARDVARTGVANFKSDFDFVLYEGDLEKFYSLMRRLNSVPNKFGGYGINIGRWKLDVWALEDTWARTAKIRKVDRVEDLLDCTFFNLDAIIFELDRGKIHTKSGYFSDLENRVLEINLEENPNPKGSVVRALRRGAAWHATFGPKLKAFLRREFPKYDWIELVNLDASAFRYPVLKHCNFDQVHQDILDDGKLNWDEIGYDYEGDNRQLELPLP